MQEKVAMIMAGGAGTRMQRSGSTLPKPLVEVGGVTLLERNLQQLLRYGFDTVYISLSNDSGLIQEFIAERLSPLAQLAGISLHEVCETSPLGNIGAAGLVHEQCSSLLVVYADNLTALDLNAVWRRHREACADITLATHLQAFRMPFGEVAFSDDQSEVTAYMEKPEYNIPVCSAISVLGPWALSAISSNSPMGISDLTQLAIAHQKRVSAYQHQAPWIDVNDLGEWSCAVKLVADNFDQFENWWSGPARTVRVPFESDLRSLYETRVDNRTLSWADIDAGEILKIELCSADEGHETKAVASASIETQVMNRLSSLSILDRPESHHSGEFR